MINNLDELIQYSEKMAVRFSVISSEIKLCSPGCSESYLSALRARAHYFPDDYLALLGRVNLLGVSMGQLNLWPVPYGRHDVLSSLVEANRSPENPWLRFYDDNAVIEVARWEANIICLGRRNTRDPGSVYFFDIRSGPNRCLRPMADSFEQLMVVAGNLHEVAMEYEAEPESGVKDFSSRLVALGINARASTLWLELLDEALS